MHLKQLVSIALIIAPTVFGCANSAPDARPNPAKIEAAADAAVVPGDVTSSSETLDFAAFADDPALPPADQLEMSEELGAACGGAWKAVVTRWYHELLHRAPDPSASGWWINLCNGTFQPINVWVSIRCSAEGQTVHQRGACR